MPSQRKRIERTEPSESAAGEAILASELSYRRLFESALDGILILDVDTGLITDVNPFLSGLLGFTHYELVGTSLWDLGPPENVEVNKAKFQQLRQQGCVRCENVPLEAKDGRLIAVDFVSNVYQAGDRNVIQCNIRDITKRKLADEALQESELRYRRLFEAARDGILILDVDTGRITDVNPFLIRLLGFSHREMFGRTVGELSPFKDIEENQVMLERLQKKGYVRYEDLPLETKDGRKIAVEFVCNVYDAGDKKVIQCNVRDITESKRAQEALCQSESRLRSIIEAEPEGVNVLSRDGRLLEMNPAGLAILEAHSIAEVENKTLMEFILPEYHAAFRDLFVRVMAGESGELEFEIIGLHGRRRWLETHAAPLRNAAGEVESLLGITRDFTDRKQAEDEIARLNAELERRVTERTAQLQTANDDLQAFSYSVSHDLRSPLRHVSSFVDVLRTEAGPSLSEGSLRHLATIDTEVKRMNRLIEDLLSFSRIGLSEIKKEEVNLDQLMKETRADFQAETEGRSIVWDIHPLPTVRADRSLLRLALVNLISNAVKFTKRRPEAKIEIGGVPGSDSETVIYIHDNGAGFNPRYADKLFGVFQRMHTQEDFAGTGIGLANVQRIIHRHDGRVWAEGVVDGGATFYFSLPRQPTAGPAIPLISTRRNYKH